ncbi:DUF3891 family protein [Fibrella sp. HMF5335]|uniref:DUF3891 family protein n=1 Tax=Fibrella rubiginis TaxID=2817060 RepID=A0A939K7Q4_9BACT|nr:DUF3891 family protein [Fibrella rubiginis]MBO0939686.1 DUF3891 family protein [Fibrella rubiginis]
MIVKLADTGWEIIHQPAHGLLAFQLGQGWKTAKRPLYWPETLIALTEHDDGQDPYEGRNHLTELGAPLNFQELEFSVEQARNMISIALQKSRWNALMVSMHSTFLYEEKRGTDAALDEFLDQQKGNQQSWRRQYGVTKAEATYAYDFVQWCDAFSLILCMNQVPPEGRRLEISKGPEGESYFVFQRPDNTVGVDPWPYEPGEFSVSLEHYAVPQLVFNDDRELYNALQKAPVERKSWVLKK